VTDFDDRDQLLEELGKALAHDLELAGKLEAAEAEAERLRAALSNMSTIASAKETRNRGAMAEVERLREDRERMRQSEQAWQNEVERLRGSRDDWVAAAEAAQREVERLRAE
jgi:chromosome segregation ATPase